MAGDGAGGNAANSGDSQPQLPPTIDEEPHTARPVGTGPERQISLTSSEDVPSPRERVTARMISASWTDVRSAVTRRTANSSATTTSRTTARSGASTVGKRLAMRELVMQRMQEESARRAPTRLDHELFSSGSESASDRVVRKEAKDAIDKYVPFFQKFRAKRKKRKPPRGQELSAAVGSGQQAGTARGPEVEVEVQRCGSGIMRTPRPPAGGEKGSASSEDDSSGTGGERRKGARISFRDDLRRTDAGKADTSYSGFSSAHRLATIRSEGDLPPHLHGSPTPEVFLNAVSRLRNMKSYESQSFDHPDSQINKLFVLSMPRHRYKWRGAVRWLLALLIGVAMGIIAFFITWLIDGLKIARMGTTIEFIEKGETASAIALYVCLALLLAFVAALPVAFYQPLAAGSGIAEVKCYLNGIHIPGLLRFTTFVIKATSMAFAVAAGMIIGTAGPAVHLGAIVGGGIGSMGSNLFNFKLTRHYNEFQSENGHRIFIAIGVAAGIATAFTAPIGGVLMAYEDCGGFYLGTTKMFWQSFLATCIGVYTNTILTLLRLDVASMNVNTSGAPRAFALYSDFVADYAKVFVYTWWEVPLFALMGCVCGLAGTAFVFLHVKLTKLRNAFIPISNPTRRTIEVVAIAALTVTVATVACYYSPCVPLPSNIDEYPSTVNITLDVEDLEVVRSNPNFPRLWCGQEEYSSFGQLFFNPVSTGLEKAIHLGETDMMEPYEFPIEVLVAYMAYAYFMLALTFASAIPAGVLVPLLAVGSCFGLLCAKLVGFVASRVTIAEVADMIVSNQAYAVIGAAAMLTGVTRMTMSITVLVVETTGSLQLTIPLMVAIFFSKVVGDLTGIGLYDAYIILKGVPYLPEEALDYEGRMVADKLDLKEIMCTDLETLPLVPTVGKVVQVLKTSGHNVFPIVANDPCDMSYDGSASPLFTSMDTLDSQASMRESSTFKVEGSISRAHLLSILEHRIGFLAEGDRAYDVLEDEVDPFLTCINQIPLKNKGETYQEKVIVGLSHEEIALRVDLRPFMQLHPYVLSGDASVAKAYRLFQNMGMNHMFVTAPGPHRVCGLITRKDLTVQNCQLKLGQRATFEMKMRRRRQSASLTPRSGEGDPDRTTTTYTSTLERNVVSPKDQ